MRHPIYASYVVVYINYAFPCVSVPTLVVALAMPVALFLRAVLEERVLRRDPAYAAYAERVRWMFFPGIV